MTKRSRVLSVVVAACLVAVVAGAGYARRAMRSDAGASPITSAEQVEEKDLPAPVVAAMRSHPRAMFVSGTKVTRNGTVQYELTLRGSRKTAMVVMPDGTVLSFQ